jgi:hypothetical protein
MDQRKKTSMLLVGMMGLAMTTMAVGFPKPSPVLTDWELQFKFQDLKRVTICLPGEGEKTYWYMVYTVTNNTGSDVTFHPEFTIVTNTLQERKSMVDVAPEVFSKIQSEYKNTYPWLENPSKVIGKVLQGKDNARDSVAIWPDFDPKATSVDVYVGGLSGEMTSVPNPLFVKGKSDPKVVPSEFVLRKTLEIHYTLPSDPANRMSIGAKRTDQDIEWIMR